MDQYCSKILALDFEKPVVDFMTDTVVSGQGVAITPVVATTAEELQHLLPPMVWKLVESAKAFASLQQAAQSISEGRATGIFQCTSVLKKCQRVTDAVAQFPDFAKHIQAVKAEWSKNIMDLLGKCDVDLAKNSCHKYAGAVEAIVAWSFGDNSVKWLCSADAPDDVRAADFKGAEGFIQSCSMSAKLIEEVCGQINDLTWATGEEVESIKAKRDIMREAGEVLKNTQNTFASLMLANAILTNNSFEATKGFVVNRLKVSLAALPLSLREQMSVYKKNPDGGAMDKTGAPPTGGQPQPHAEGEKPKKKLRRLTVT